MACHSDAMMGEIRKFSSIIGVVAIIGHFKGHNLAQDDGAWQEIATITITRINKWKMAILWGQHLGAATFDRIALLSSKMII
jgi:hypothetical protein